MDFGLLLGGLFRLVPEVIGYLGKKRDNDHELELLREQVKLETAQTNNSIREKEVSGNFDLWKEQIAALREAIAGQEKPSGIAWVDAWNKLLRPMLISWWCIGLYSLATVCGFVALISAGINPVDAVLRLWGPEEKEIVKMMLSFLFVDRSLKYIKVS